MILKGSQRGGAGNLAAHLLRLDENDHVEVHELRGVSSDDLRGALQEIDAVAKGTKCVQFLFSLSLNPPDTERVTVEQFESAIDRAEAALGLGGQARAIVFHEKQGRRHAHVVWSRIDIEGMKAINLPFYKMRLRDLSRALYLDHGWRLPDGLRDPAKRNPLNFTIAEWQQAKRAKRDATALKLDLKECWSVSDNRAAFERALGEKGFLLARGDRRGFVALDMFGEVYSLSRWLDQKSKALSDKLGDAASLRDASTAKAEIAGRMGEKVHALICETEAEIEISSGALLAKKTDLRTRQRDARQELRDRQQTRADEAARDRSARFRKGLGGIWDWLSGRTRKLRDQNARAAEQALTRDAHERETLIAGQLSERRLLQRDIRTAKRDADERREELRADLSLYLGMREPPEPSNAGTRKQAERSRAPGRDL